MPARPVPDNRPSVEIARTRIAMWINAQAEVGDGDGDGDGDGEVKDASV